MSSYYLDKFRRGAPLLPQCFWFVEPTPDATPDPGPPFVETSSDAYKKSKKQWQFIGRGRIEDEFVFTTIRAKYLSPFFPVNHHSVFLPAIETANGIQALDSAQLLEHGKLYAARWMKDIEQAWQDQRGRQGILFSLYSIISSCKELLVQHPKKDVVVFNRRGRSLNAAMYCPQDNQEYLWKGFIAHHKTHFYYPETQDEGHYLCSMLNSDVVNQLARSYSLLNPGRGKTLFWKPLEACLIPRFTQENAEHIRLAKLGRECQGTLQQRAAKAQKTAAGNKRFIQMQIQSIDQLAASVLQQQGQSIPFVQKHAERAFTMI